MDSSFGSVRRTYRRTEIRHWVDHATSVRMRHAVVNACRPVLISTPSTRPVLFFYSSLACNIGVIVGGRAGKREGEVLMALGAIRRLVVRRRLCPVNGILFFTFPPKSLNNLQVAARWGYDLNTPCHVWTARLVCARQPISRQRPSVPLSKNDWKIPREPFSFLIWFHAYSIIAVEANLSC